jgi:hypothetical protein
MSCRTGHQLRHGGIHPCGIGAADHQIGAMRAVLDERIGPHRQVGKLGRQRAEIGGDVALAPVHAQGLAQQRCAPGQVGQHRGHHRLEYLGHAGHHMHVADGKAGRGGHRVVDQLRAVGDARHALARIVEGQACAVVMRGQQRHRIGAVPDRHAKGRGDRVGGDVVMRGADPAAGEDMRMRGAQPIQRGHDLGVIVGHHAHLAQRRCRGGSVRLPDVHVAVARAARQDLVADDKHGGAGLGGGVGHVGPLRFAPGIGPACGGFKPRPRGSGHSRAAGLSRGKA